MKHADPFFFVLSGKCSSFGGPNDKGMRKTEGVALYGPGSDDPYSLFLPGRGRLGHDLNPAAYFCAMRFLYGHHSVEAVRGSLVRVEAAATGRVAWCHPADWGPADWTDRIVDVSDQTLRYLGVQTDAEVYVSGLWVP